MSWSHSVLSTVSGWNKFRQKYDRESNRRPPEEAAELSKCRGPSEANASPSVNLTMSGREGSFPSRELRASPRYSSVSAPLASSRAGQEGTHTWKDQLIATHAGVRPAGIKWADHGTTPGEEAGRGELCAPPQGPGSLTPR